MYDLLIRSAFVSLLLFPVSLLAQLPPNQPEQDCIFAIPLCQDTYFQSNAYSGAGENPDEINGDYSCMKIGERNSVWYRFTVQTTGSLCFTITPVDPLDDYDWALFNITNASCASIYNDPGREVSCNWTYNNGCGGVTGANGSANCPDQNEPCLNVVAGETYVLNVSNFTSSNSGYTLDFSQSLADLYDDISPNVRSMSSFCHGVTVEFDEPILCHTVDSLDFTFTGPDGPYHISDILSANCNEDGSGYSYTFDLVVSPPISQPGNYQVSLVGAVTDFCGNVANLHSQSVFMPQPPVAAMNTPDPQCQEINQFGFAYTGPSSVVNYQWSFGDGSQSTTSTPVHQYRDFGLFDVSLVIRDNNGCRDTAVTQVEVLPAPVAAFHAPPTICQGEELTFSNLSFFPGNATLSSQQWFFSDGFPSNEVNPSHVFTFEDSQWVLLEVFNNFGCRDTFSQHLLVYPQPDVDFLVEDDVCIYDTANLIYRGTIRSDIADDQIVDWYWNMGDSTVYGAITEPIHLYDTAGTYPVTLTIVSDKGCADSLVKEQIIHRPPPPIVTDPRVCFGDKVFLEAATPVVGGRTYWYHGMNDTEHFFRGIIHEVNPVVEWDTFYTEIISLRGCVSERVPVVQSYHAVGEGSISFSDSVVDFPQPIVDFGVEGSILAAEYNWDLGETTSTFEAPVHEYLHPGRYKITVNIMDIYGCLYDLERVLHIRNVPQVQVPSAFSPNGDGFNDEFYIGHQMLRDFSFRIFNRFGEEIFMADSPEFRWDGRGKKGEAIRQGVYMYHLEAIDYIGNTIKRDGAISLIR